MLHQLRAVVSTSYTCSGVSFSYETSWAKSLMNFAAASTAVLPFSPRTQCQLILYTVPCFKLVQPARHLVTLLLQIWFLMKYLSLFHKHLTRDALPCILNHWIGHYHDLHSLLRAYVHSYFSYSHSLQKNFKLCEFCFLKSNTMDDPLYNDTVHTKSNQIYPYPVFALTRPLLATVASKWHVSSYYTGAVLTIPLHIQVSLKPSCCQTEVKYRRKPG